MYIHSIENLHLGEIKLMRKALDEIKITGADAKFVAVLQEKVEYSIKEAEKPKTVSKKKTKPTE
jgi:hypothetical protein